MKARKFRFSSLFYLIMAICIVYGGGCSSDSSSETDGTSSTEGTITQVTITGASSVLANGTAKLTANLILSGTVDTSKVTYSWNITNGGNYASLSSSNENPTTLKANDVTQQQSVTVLVIVKYGNLEKTAQKTITVTAKSSDSGSGSGGSTDSGSGSSSDSGSGSSSDSGSGTSTNSGSGSSTDSGSGSSSGSGGGTSTDSGSSAVLSGVSVTASSSTIDYNGKATLTATPSFYSGSSSNVTYEWEITSGDSYATLTADGATATLQGKNSTSYSKYVSVKVTAKCNRNEWSWYTGITVKGFSFSVAVESSSSSIECNGSTTLTATPYISSGSSEDVTYEWEITEGDSYATLSADGATAVLQGKNSTTESQMVTVKVTAKYNGFERSNQKQITIGDKAEYSITYYKRYNGDIITGLTPSAFDRTEDVDLSTAVPEKAGYKFEGWSTSNSSDDIITGWKAGEITKNVSLYAIWTAKTDTKYTVEHYQKNLDAARTSSGYGDYSDYTLVETETHYGTTDKDTAAVAKNYEGFNSENFSQKTIYGDGSTVVKIKYNRKYVTLTLDLEYDSTHIRGYYGESIDYSSPTRYGYTFNGWSPELPETFPAEDTTYTAHWTANSLGSITASAPEYSSNDKDFLTTDTSDSSIIFTADADCSWYVDGDLKSSSGTTFTMNIADYSKGYYTVMAISGNHSATVQVTVSK